MTPAQLLAFEAAHPAWNGTKKDAIRAELGMTPVKYALLLTRAACTTEGIAADPITARRTRQPGTHTRLAQATAYKRRA